MQHPARVLFERPNGATCKAEQAQVQTPPDAPVRNPRFQCRLGFLHVWGLPGKRRIVRRGCCRRRHDSVAIAARAEHGRTDRRAILDAMSDLWPDDADDDVSPICGDCGVSALPPEAPGEPSMCENPNCSAFGEPIFA